MKRSIGFIAGFIILSSLTCVSFAATYYVNPGEKIQDAIDSATHGDTVIVYPGIYYENIFFNGKNIVLTGSDPENMTVVENTIIDGSLPTNPDTASVVTFGGSETEECVLSGFTLRNGTGTKIYVTYLGFPWFLPVGGGIIGNGTEATIHKNIIIANNASHKGGGLYDCDGEISGNTISDNWAADGGGLSECDGLIKDNIINGNIAVWSGGG